MSDGPKIKPFMMQISRERLMELIEREPDDCEIGAGCIDLEALNREAMLIQMVERNTRKRVIADVQRALRLYPEWCRSWGLDRNMNAATEGAIECANMLEHLPINLPSDDEDAGCMIARAIEEGIPK